MSIKFLELKRAYYADPENVRVEVRTPDGVWRQCVNEPAWQYFEYRIRPCTIRIGDIDVPEPVREALKDGTQYFTAAIDLDDFYNVYTWYSDLADAGMLKAGIVHLTKEAAIAHAKALILVSGGTVE